MHNCGHRGIFRDIFIELLGRLGCEETVHDNGLLLEEKGAAKAVSEVLSRDRPACRSVMACK